MSASEGSDVALTLVIPLRAKATMSLPDFYQYWLNAHVTLPPRFPGISSIWLHCAAAHAARVDRCVTTKDRGAITLARVRGVAVADLIRRLGADSQREAEDDLALSGVELGAVRAPVLMVHGRDDRVVPWRSSSAQLLDLLPDARLHVLSDCGHWTMIERTADFLAVVQPFLAA
jgi:pimeloyl-ACP methyl ester carboxylesterase